MECVSCYDSLPDKDAVKCTSCAAIACKACMLKHLHVLHQEHKTPICIGCQKELGREFLMTTIPSFRKTYNTWQKERLKRSQDDRIPASLEFVGPYKRLREEEERKPLLVAKRIEAKKNYDEATKELALSTDRAEVLRITAGIKANVGDPLRHCRVCNESVTWWQGNCPTCGTPRASAAPLPAAAAAAPVLKVLCGCPVDKCVGYVLEDGTCPVCSKTMCLACHEVAEDDGHRCDPSTVLSVAAIKTDTKLCPNTACGTPIHRIHGCNNMWCILCGTFFDWKTLAITRQAHNPEHIKFKQALNGAGITKTTTACNPPVGVRAAVFLARTMHAHLHTKDTATVYAVAGLLIPMQTCLTKKAAKTEDARFLNNDIHRELRLDFMIGKISEEEFADTLHRREKQAEYESELQAISNTFLAVGNELLDDIRPVQCAAAVPSIEALVAQYNIAVEALAVIFATKPKSIVISYTTPAGITATAEEGWGTNTGNRFICTAKCLGGYV